MEVDMNSPSLEVARKIVSKLTAAKLIRADDEENITAKLSEGKLRQEDWRLAIEKAIDAKEES